MAFTKCGQPDDKALGEVLDGLVVLALLVIRISDVVLCIGRVGVRVDLRVRRRPVRSSSSTLTRLLAQI